MGTYKNGINGAFSGKIGNVVGATYRGIDYMRSLPETSDKPASEKQANQRALMGMVSGWLRPLKALIAIGYQMFNGAKTPMNVCVAFHLKEAIKGNSALNYTIDFAKAVFSRGELMISTIREVSMQPNSILRIKWEDAAFTSVFCRNDDEATVIVYNPDKSEFVTFENIAQRMDQQVDLTLPDDFEGDVLHAWMHYTNTAGNAVSTSLYLGMLGRPVDLQLAAHS